MSLRWRYRVAAAGLAALLACSPVQAQKVAKATAKHAERSSRSNELPLRPFAGERELVADPVEFADATAERLWKFLVQKARVEESSYYASSLKGGGEFAPLGADCFLVLHLALLQACPAKGTLEQLTPDNAPGNTELGEPHRIPSGGFWVLAGTGGLSRGVFSQAFFAIVFRPRATGGLSTTSVAFASAANIMGEEPKNLCGTADDRNETPLDVASSIDAHIVRDLNGDGVDDASFKLTEENCRTGVTRKFTSDFIYRNGTFQLRRSR